MVRRGALCLSAEPSSPLCAVLLDRVGYWRRRHRERPRRIGGLAGPALDSLATGRAGAAAPLDGAYRVDDGGWRIAAAWLANPRRSQFRAGMLCQLSLRAGDFSAVRR